MFKVVVNITFIIGNLNVFSIFRERIVFKGVFKGFSFQGFNFEVNLAFAYFFNFNLNNRMSDTDTKNYSKVLVKDSSL